ncbi:hypothetical protein [Methanolobus halotolerans]|uniref:Uncharacterized protein n=1 Tax=Methanolobus halotolerans TaxID=2052935 RepID=A0A4E0Q3L3_9EURY|nr:hypothetical protein [Methanolobus halotolerans]TGC08041.1 hypothetical protein CUN85_10405 [Methanolobus halotolerans]
MDYEGLLKNSWDFQKDNIVTYAVAALIAFVGSILIVTIAPLAYGFTYMAVKGARKEPVEINDVFEGFRNGNFIRSWIYMLIYLVVLGIAGQIHSILSTIVGIVFIFGLPLLVIKGYSGVDAVKETFEIVKENPVESLILYVIIAVLNVIGAIALLIGLLITAPLSQIMLANATLELSGKTHQTTENYVAETA